MALILSTAKTIFIILLTILLFISFYFDKQTNDGNHHLISIQESSSLIHNLTNLENIFCNNGLACSLSTGDNDNNIINGKGLIKLNGDYYCTSIYNLFISLRNGCANNSRDKNSFDNFDKNLIRKLSNNSVIDTLLNNVSSFKTSTKEEIGTAEDEQNDNVEGESIEESNTTTTSLAYLLICLLLLLSMTVSLIEFCRERKRKVTEDANDASNGPSETCGGGGSRRMSIVDLTVSRHARKESQQRDSVTGFNSGTARVPPPLIRRSSFPAQMPEVKRGRAHLVPRQQTWSPQGASTNSRRVSIDFTEDDGSPDRRRVRIIRRH